MYTVKMPEEGKLIEGPRGAIWISPQQAISVAFPEYVRKVGQILEADQTTDAVLAFRAWAGDRYDQEIERMLRSLCKIVSLRVDPATHGLTLPHVMSASGFYALPMPAQHLLSHLMFRVVVSAWYHGAGEALAGEHHPYLRLMQVDNYIQFTEGQPNGFRRLRRRLADLAIRVCARLR